MWETFTLGGTPYSDIDSQQLFAYLKDGNRLRKPRLCDQDTWVDDVSRGLVSVNVNVCACL